MQKTSFPFEIIIYDDASTDKTAQIVKENVDKYPHLFIPIFQTENQYSKGVNLFSKYVFPKARGEYLALCEGDDYWTDPNKLQKQVTFLDNHPTYAMCSHEVEITFEGVEKVDNLYGEPIIDADFDQILNATMFIALNSIVYRKRYLSVMPDWLDKLPGAHRALILLVTSKGRNYHFLDKMGVKRKNPGGITYVQKRFRDKQNKK